MFVHIHVQFPMSCDDVHFSIFDFVYMYKTYPINYGLNVTESDFPIKYGQFETLPIKYAQMDYIETYPYIVISRLPVFRVFVVFVFIDSSCDR